MLNSVMLWKDISVLVYLFKLMGLLPRAFQIQSLVFLQGRIQARDQKAQASRVS